LKSGMDVHTVLTLWASFRVALTPGFPAIGLTSFRVWLRHAESQTAAAKASFLLYELIVKDHPGELLHQPNGGCRQPFG
jgi:hypothetical protein